MRNPSTSSAAAAWSSSSHISPADGFLCVKDGVDDMIKNVANEPSVGLYFVQQHAHASMPLLLDVKNASFQSLTDHFSWRARASIQYGNLSRANQYQFLNGSGSTWFEGKVAEKIHEVTLHTEDIEDSICAVRSMTEFGLPIADDMIKDINKSLQIMSKTQTKRGLIQNPSWGFQSGKSSTWDDLDTTNGGSSQNYFSSMFNTAKQKASGLRWSPPDFTTKDDSSKKLASFAAPESFQASGHGGSTPSDAERDEPPVSSRLLENPATRNQSLSATDISNMVESYNKFKEEQELKLQDWLRASEEAEDDKE